MVLIRNSRANSHDAAEPLHRHRSPDRWQSTFALLVYLRKTFHLNKRPKTFSWVRWRVALMTGAGMALILTIILIWVVKTAQLILVTPALLSWLS